MNNWLRSLMDRMAGRGGATPPPRSSRSASQRAVESGIRIEYQSSEGVKPQPPSELRWKRERADAPRASMPAVRRPRIGRRLLAGLVVVALLVSGWMLLAPLLVNRRLPAATWGVWETDVAGYEGRRFELRAHRVVFATPDSAVAVHLIERVRSTAVENGTRYQVEYADSGRTLEFIFQYFEGPPPTIRLGAQPRIAWRRLNTTRSLMPEF